MSVGAHLSSHYNHQPWRLTHLDALLHHTTSVTAVTESHLFSRINLDQWLIKSTHSACRAPNKCTHIMTHLFIPLFISVPKSKYNPRSLMVYAFKSWSSDVLICSQRPRWCHTDSCGERPGEVSPPWRKTSSKLPGPGFRHRHTVFSAASNCICWWLAWRSGGNAQDNARLPSGGEVCHAGWWGVYAQTRPERNGDAKGQSHLGVRKYHPSKQLQSNHLLHTVTPVTIPEQGPPL